VAILIESIFQSILGYFGPICIYQPVSLSVCQASQQICQPQQQRALDICMGLFKMFTLVLVPPFRGTAGDGCLHTRISFKLN